MTQSVHDFTDGDSGGSHQPGTVAGVPCDLALTECHIIPWPSFLGSNLVTLSSCWSLNTCSSRVLHVSRQLPRSKKAFVLSAPQSIVYVAHPRTHSSGYWQIPKNLKASSIHCLYAERQAFPKKLCIITAFYLHKPFEAGTCIAPSDAEIREITTPTSKPRFVAAMM